MEQYKVLMQNEVIEKGMCFDGNIICHGGEFGQQVCRILSNGTEESVTGLVYELYSNSNLNYYCYYVDGISNGQYVCFYENGNLKSVTNMYKGARHGAFTEWYEDETLKTKGSYKYGFCEKLVEWNCEGVTIKEQLEPKEFDKVMIEKYERHKCKDNEK